MGLNFSVSKIFLHKHINATYKNPSSVTFKFITTEKLPTNVIVKM